MRDNKTMFGQVVRGAALACASLIACVAHAAAPGITGTPVPQNLTVTGPFFDLTAAAGYTTQPDGASIYTWGYGCNTAPDNSQFAPSGISGNGNAYGMNLVSGPFQAERNFVTGMTPLGTGSARGIWGDSVPSSYRNNTVISIAPVTGVGLDGGSPGPATCGENTVTGFSTDITNCADAGGNVSN